jgi:hypothetical protein
VRPTVQGVKAVLVYELHKLFRQRVRELGSLPLLETKAKAAQLREVLRLKANPRVSRQQLAKALRELQ